MTRRFILGLVTVLTAAPAVAQIAPTQPYLMAFHGCDGTLCRDPRNHVVYLAESVDGASWTMVPGWTTFFGSVPDVIQRGRTLYVYTANSMVARFDLDAGTVDRVPVRVTGLPSGVSSDWVDPSMFVDDAGQLVLFLMYAPLGSGDPARCASGVTSCTKQFFSATEVAGSNGTQFTLDPGDRATVTIPSTGSQAAASDPDVFFDGTQYVMYISHGSSTSVWTSTALRGTYTRSTTLPSGMLSSNRGGVPAGHFDVATSRYWTYVHAGQAGTSVIRRAVHANLTQALVDASFTTVMTGQGMGLGASISVESPSFAVLTRAPAALPAHCPVPDAPGPLFSTMVGNAVALDWGGVGNASGYVLEVGSAPGASDLATTGTGGTTTSLTAQVLPAGTYYMRIRAANQCGTGAASDEAAVVVR